MRKFVNGVEVFDCYVRPAPRCRWQLVAASASALTALFAIPPEKGQWQFCLAEPGEVPRLSWFTALPVPRLPLAVS